MDSCDARPQGDRASLCVPKASSGVEVSLPVLSLRMISSLYGKEKEKKCPRKLGFASHAKGGMVTPCEQTCKRVCAFELG